VLFVGGPGTAACHVYDGDQTNCEKAFHMSQCGPASCWYDVFSANCNGCGPSNQQQGVCVNTCVDGPPTCEGDASRTIFAGYAGTAACQALSFSASLCVQAFHIGGDGVPASCYYDGDAGECRGCGPNNLENGSCENTCPVCPGNPARTTYAGGPGQSGCTRFSTQSSCEGAFIIGGSEVEESCFFDSGDCRGCGRNNFAAGLCDNECASCENDPSRVIFVGGPFTSACDVFSNNPILCEQAFHVSGECPAFTACYYDFDDLSCRGCGPFNQSEGRCTNTCAAPICGNNVVDLPGEQCDGPDLGTCGPSQLCTFNCQCASCSAAVIPASGGVFMGTTSGTGVLASACGFGTLAAPEAIYEWTPSTTGIATVDTCSGTTNFDTVLGVRQGSCGGTEIACNDDASGCGLRSRVVFFSNAGTTYYIVVDGYGGQSGDFTLTVTPASPSGAFLDLE
jgi:hypothetical protein